MVILIDSSLYIGCICAAEAGCRYVEEVYSLMPIKKVRGTENKVDGQRERERDCQRVDLLG